MLSLLRVDDDAFIAALPRDGGGFFASANIMRLVQRVMYQPDSESAIT